MSRQKIFKLPYLIKLYNEAKTYEGQEKYIKDELNIDLTQTLEYPNIEEPTGLVDKLDPNDFFKSAVALYEAYQNLELIQASDPRFWTYLTHVQLFSYMHSYRSKQIHSEVTHIDEDENRKQPKTKEDYERNGWTYLQDHWFVSPSAKTAGNFSRHDFASMWWMVYLTVEPSLGKEHQYDITKVMTSNRSAVTFILLRSKVFRVQTIFKSVGHFVYDNWDTIFNGQNMKTKFRYIFDYLNMIGGKTNLAYLDRDQVDELLVNIGPSLMKYANIPEGRYLKQPFKFDK